MIRQGDKGDFFYVVERGEFAVFVADGTDVALAADPSGRARQRVHDQHVGKCQVVGCRH